MAQALGDLIKNPSVVKEITQKALEASKMTKERLDEVEVARTTLEDNKRTHELLIETMRAHKEEVDSATRTLDRREADLNAKQANHEDSVKSSRSDIDRQTSDVKALNEVVLRRSKDIEIKEQDITRRELTCKEIVASVLKRESVCEQREKAIQIEIAKLDARRKKLMEATKED